MRKQYTEAFKLQVVRDIERGKVTATEVGRKYGINGTLTIPRWLKRYSRSKASHGLVTRPTQGQEVNKLAFLEQRNKELEQVIAKLTIEKVALDALIEEAQLHLGVDLKKTFGMGR